MAPEVKTAKNSKLPKLSENCFEPVGKGGWPPISIWITLTELSHFAFVLIVLFSWAILHHVLHVEHHLVEEHFSHLGMPLKNTSPYTSIFYISCWKQLWFVLK
jgi:hypothetical protein